LRSELWHRGSAISVRKDLCLEGKAALQKWRTAPEDRPFSKSLKEMAKVQELVRFVCSQYPLAYRSTNRKLDNTWRAIKVPVSEKALRSIIARGYYAR
jgi:hypothetical protein